MHTNDTVIPPLNTTAAQPDLCTCELRCPCCGKLRAGHQPVFIPVPAWPQPQPLYWWQPGGSPTCAVNS